MDSWGTVETTSEKMAAECLFRFKSAELLCVMIQLMVELESWYSVNACESALWR